MKITIVTVGKPRARWAIDSVDHYRRFVSKYADCEIRHVRAVSAADGNARTAIRAESERLIECLSTLRGFTIVCDSKGRSFESVAFASKLRHGADSHGDHLVIILGGAWGLDQRVLDRADLVWAFGPLTLPHELALIVAMEQVARGLSILRGEKYHK